MPSDTLDFGMVCINHRFLGDSVKPIVFYLHARSITVLLHPEIRKTCDGAWLDSWAKRVDTCLISRDSTVRAKHAGQRTGSGQRMVKSVSKFAVTSIWL